MLVNRDIYMIENIIEYWSRDKQKKREREKEREKRGEEKASPLRDRP